MKYLILALLLLTSCAKTEQLCNAGKVAATKIATPVAKRWVCDQAKVTAFFESKIGPVTCPVAAPVVTPMNLVSIPQSLCPLVIGYLVDLGADKIAADMGCDKEKVSADLGNSAKLCDLLKN